MYWKRLNKKKIHCGSAHPLRIRTSTRDPRIHYGSTYPLLIRVSTLDPRNHYGSAYPLWIHVSTMDLHIHSGSTYPLWIGISTLDPLIHYGSAYPLWIHATAFTLSQLTAPVHMSSSASTGEQPIWASPLPHWSRFVEALPLLRTLRSFSQGNWQLEVRAQRKIGRCRLSSWQVPAVWHAASSRWGHGSRLDQTGSIIW